MTKSQNAKDEQQKDLCITSEQLTEQWKKGELPSGWYWVELKEGTFVGGKKSITLDYLFDFTNDFERHPYLVESVLAEVPSFKQWQAKLEENTKLKGLLKELKRYFDADGRYYIDKRILLEINQVLGEK